MECAEARGNMEGWRRQQLRMSLDMFNEAFNEHFIEEIVEQVCWYWILDVMPVKVC